MNQCSQCKYQINPEWFFCPNCGKELRIKPISFGRQIFIYTVSFFLAPLGLGWGIKYIRSKDNKVRLVGLIAIVLTLISVVLLIATFKNVMDQYSKLLNNYGIIR
ncbi:hypothetical protein A2767_03225 [Candidatus Roizmanbacteria bacterium RIFCSPHIGHO2_01_FULL_35_10]|uniref:Zinc-ribbon domain-containing protein n=1 Tax=Candidatus Roizmanbacteria bacterium RIFCSPLOWO2_01_FULL_35_13 TaxID=1802055 RepID=A0A1F7IH72_9BACT|nr:MAG: hypothetical protein A2767_03225 [Candidatus Roizmanbacteria bacterium RIFCSPHIGHO2_01_FULL_35_10]OGK42698.1 MAG: hypothetical protein A3A74_00125 [Candidatus Roizmanbacteria bacterium RIFCSPLOWO2_01_FULL_35_13]